VSNLLLEQLTAINPHPAQSEVPDEAVSSTTALLAVERKSGAKGPVGVPVGAIRSAWRGPLIAAAVFGIVLLVAIVLSISGGGVEPASPVTTTVAEQPVSTTIPETTTTVPPTTTTTTATVVDAVSAGERAAADAAIAALNAHSTEDLFALMAESAPAAHRIQKSESAVVGRSRDLFERYLSFDFALGTTWTIVSCEPASTVSSVRCAVDVHEPLRDELGLRVLPALLRIDVDQAGLIQELDFRWDTADPLSALGTWVEELVVFTDWVDENHPGDMEIMAIEILPLTSPASLALWESHVAEFLDGRG
jgi:hypothetical protein